MGDTVESFGPSDAPIIRRDPAILPNTDNDFIAACARGETAALGRLFDRHHIAIHRFLARMLGAQDPDLEELVNETFLHIYRAARSFGGRSSVKTWMTAIAANVARHHVRSETRRRAFLRVWQGRAIGVGEDEGRSAEQRDLLRRLGRLLRTLPHDLRVVFVMCDLEEIPGAEAARALGVPEGTLWRRLHEARKSLRTSLYGEGHA